MRVINHDAAILVVGGGTWGASTALHLARRGYKNVTVLDPYGYPSPIAAGNDVNKIVEAESFQETLSTPPSENPTANDILNRATSHGWLKDPIFTPHYHETGYVCAASSPDGLEFLHESEKIKHDPTAWKPLNTAEDFRSTMPEGILTGEFKGWKGWFKARGAGWAHARNAYVAAAKEAERLGVRFVSGKPQGAVVSLIHEDGDIVGARTADGMEHRAARTILAAGAYADALLDFKGQLLPKAWTLLHIRMTAEEAQQYKNLPVLFNVESGFFIEPDSDKHELKICDEHPGYTNLFSSYHDNSNDTPDLTLRKSIPFARHQVPLSSLHRARSFLSTTMPHLSTRPFSFARICWCADTPDRQFLISTHPEYASLILGVGGSGHGYSHITSVGGFIVDVMEGVLDETLREAWRWRPETAVGRDWRKRQGRFGAGRRVMDFGEVEGEGGWTRIGEGEHNGTMEVV